MSNVSQFLQEGTMIDYTPVGAVTAGNILQVGSLSAFSPLDIAAGKLGAVAVDGVIRGPYVGGVANIGDNIWWDANGTPYGGAATGAYTRNAAAGDWWVGTLVRAVVAASTTCDIALNKVNENLPAWTGRTHFQTAADLTMVEATHSGGVIHVTQDGGFDTTILFPVGVVGMEYIIQSDAGDGINRLTIDLNGNETIIGANFTLTATNTAKNTLLTAKRGDYMHLVCEGTAGAWRCVAKRGAWENSA